MNRSLLICALAALIATPSISFATELTNHQQARIAAVPAEQVMSNHNASVKPGKSKKYKKKMSKQMKKRKRH